MEPREALSALLVNLEQEETAITALLELAAAEHSALLVSDFPRLDAVTAKMLRIAESLEATESQRNRLLETLGIAGAGLNELITVAETYGMRTFNEVGGRLEEAASRLHDAQEQNARLIISAARMRERWLAMLTQIANPTYTPDGPNGDNGYRFVSKSA